MILFFILSYFLIFHMHNTIIIQISLQTYFESFSCSCLQKFFFIISSYEFKILLV